MSENPRAFVFVTALKMLFSFVGWIDLLACGLFSAKGTRRIGRAVFRVAVRSGILYRSSPEGFGGKQIGYFPEECLNIGRSLAAVAVVGSDTKFAMSGVDVSGHFFGINPTDKDGQFCAAVFCQRFIHKASLAC